LIHFFTEDRAVIIRHLDAARASIRRVDAPRWSSVRLLLESDAMGFSFHITTIHQGANLEMHYRHHLESVYCISGHGWIEDRATGSRHEIHPGSLYALDRHDRHRLLANSEMILACVFNPPLRGREIHDASGAYPEVGEALA
jgi:L-ectoine synthase